MAIQPTSVGSHRMPCEKGLLMQENPAPVDLSAAAERDRIARSVPVIRTAPVGDLEAGLHRNTVGMALALNGRNIYAGTVSGAEKAKRRAVGKRQRAARKGHRS